MNKAKTKLKVKILKRYYRFTMGGDLKRIKSFARLPLEHRKAFNVVAILLVATVYAGSLIINESAKALTYNMSSKEIMDGYRDFNQIQTQNDNKTFTLQRGDIGSWEGGDGLGMIRNTVHGEPNMFYGPGGNFYTMQGRSGCGFNVWDIELKFWKELKSPPVGCSTGHSMAYDGKSSFYYFPAGNNPDMYRYDAGDDNWVRLADLPASIGHGASVTYVESGQNSALYAMRGNASASFWKYEIANNAWVALSSFPTTNSVSEGTRVMWDKSNFVYVIANYTGEFKRYSLSANTWSNLSSASQQSCEVYSLVEVAGKMYAPSIRRCNETTRLQRYDPVTNTWSGMATPPIGWTYDWQFQAASDGTDNIVVVMGYHDQPRYHVYQVSTNTWKTWGLTQQNNHYSMHEPFYDGGDYIYYIGGHGLGSMDGVYRKHLGTGEITRIGAQINSNIGAGGVYANNALYAVNYFGGNGFGKFDLNTNDFIPLANAPFNSNWGSDLVDGADGYLYATFPGRSNFYRYSEANGWQSLNSMPRTISEGSQMSRIGRDIYVLAGGSQVQLLRYNMDTGAWSTLQDSPIGGVSHGGFMTGDGSRYLYAGLGNRTESENTKFYRYDTVSNSWSRMADIPQPAQVGARAFYQSTTGNIWLMQGPLDNRLFKYTPSSANYVTSGSWYSKEIDLKQAQTWTGLNITQSGSGTTIAYTRTSANGRVWTNWQQVTGTTINSPLNRYIQIKVTLSGNGSNTPVIQDINLNYTQESTAPNLPSQFNAFSANGGQAISTGVTYEHQHPYFRWSGANDGTNGSGIDGYYVYFGTSSNADPVTAGSYQTTQDYTVTTPMTAGDIYYVRIKVKDKLGNISDAATYFSYRYFYISPPGSVMTSTQTDFSNGINNGMSIGSDGSLSLVRQTQGAWSTGETRMLPFDSDYGSSMTVVGDFLYTARGQGTGDFFRYNIESLNWEQRASLPSGVGHGSSMTSDKNNYLYAISGSNSSAFYRYNIVNNVWESLPNLPAFAQYGSMITHIGNNKIAIILTGAAEMYIYDTTARSYMSVSSPPLSVTGYAGSGMWFDGNGTLYVAFGPYDMWQSNTRRQLASYNVSQDTWKVFPKAPNDFYYNQNILTGDGRGRLYMFGNDFYEGRSLRNVAHYFDIATETWNIIENSSATLGNGTIAGDGKRYIYIIPNNYYGRKLVRFDTYTNTFSPSDIVTPAYQRLTWDFQSSWTWTARQGTTMAYDGNDYVYAIGGNQSHWGPFIRRSLSTQQTKYLAMPPLIGISGALQYLNGSLYYLPGATSTMFYKYDPGTDSWMTMQPLPATIVEPGTSALVKISGNRLVAFRGNSNSVYMYTPDAGLGTWTTLANAPQTMRWGAYDYDGGDFIYALRGNNTNSFYRYSISGNTWTTLANLPGNASRGSTLIHRQGVLYAGRGNDSVDMYQYNIASNTWASAPAAPDYFRHGGSAVKINEDYALYMPGESNSNIWRYIFPAADKAYSPYGTHVSQPISIDGLFDYAGIKASVNIPDKSRVEFWTRTSADGSTWDDWIITDQVKYFNGSMSVRIASTPKQFTQVQVKLFSQDNSTTPTVNDFSVDYYFDTTPPSNPTVLTAYRDNTKATTINDNVWYNYPAPMFDWPNPGQAGGATDGPLGSNLKGYYVYVGTDPTAMPRTAGVFVTDTQYNPTLTTSGTYYVRIQAQDITGNVDPAVYAPFRYKFDNNPPSQPTLITVTPSGFTGRNNYTFQWPNSFDNESGIRSYCYHTGALSGPFAVEACQDGTDLMDVEAAYQPGTNTFYVRTLDIAGNYSTAYAQASYYYSTDPPTPVTNFRAVPPNSEQNLFAFIWDLPVMFSGDPDALVYCYSVNSLPGPTNTTCVDDTFISPFKAATQEGVNSIYMVAKDEAGNVNWNNYAVANFIANTVSPGIPLNLVVNDTSDSTTSRWSLTMTWDKPLFEGNGIAEYVLERSEDNHTFEEIGRVSNLAYVDLAVEPDKDYFYRVRASDNVDNQGGASGIVTARARGNFAVPPRIVSVPQVTPGFDQATIRWVTDRPSTSFVYYGNGPSSLGQSKGSLDLATEHVVTITGLQPSSNYYFKVQSFDNNRAYDLSQATSQLYTLKTTETARLYSIESSDVGIDSAVVSWESSIPTRAKIEYGPTRKYGFTQDNAQGYSTTQSMKLDGLPSGTTMHYRIVATTDIGSIVTSDDYVFTTIARPVISGVRFQPVEEGNTVAVKVSWNTNVPTSSELTYRALGVKKEFANTTMTTNHEVILTDLASSTEYDFEVRGRDNYGYITSIGGQKWTSGTDTKEPNISDVSISTTTMTSIGARKAQMIVTWKTDEPTTTQVQYAKASSAKLDILTPLDTEPTVNHIVVISNLDLAQVYKIQPISRDISGNTAYNAELVAVTPDTSESPLDIILNTLQRIFRL